MGFAILLVEYNVQVVTNQTPIQRNSNGVGNTFTNLVNMRGSYLAGMRRIGLYLVVFCNGVLLYNYFNYPIGKTFLGTEGVEGFNKLHLCTLSYKHQRAGLRQHIGLACIGNVIDVYRMLYYLSFFDMHKHAILYKGSAQCIDTIFEVIAAMAKVL